MESELLEKLSLDGDSFGQSLFLHCASVPMVHVVMAAVREAAHSDEERSYVDEDDAPLVTLTWCLWEVNQLVVPVEENVLARSWKDVVKVLDDVVTSYYVDCVVTDWVYFEAHVLQLVIELA